MKKKISFLKILSCLGIAFVLSSCNKEYQGVNLDQSEGEPARITNWLESRKLGVTKSEGTGLVVSINSSNSDDKYAMKNANIDLLKKNLHFSAAIKLRTSKKTDLLFIPINDEVRAQKRLPDIVSLTLVVAMDKDGKVSDGKIVVFYPKDGKRRASSSAVIANIFNNKPGNDSGTFKFLSVTGQLLHQFDYVGNRVKSNGRIHPKDKTDNVSTNSVCIDWYLTTTYYEDGVAVFQTDEYIGTTCDGCNDGSYESLCSDGSGGGGGGSSDPTIVSYTQTTNNSSQSSGSDDAAFTEDGGTPDAGIASIIFWPGIQYVHPYEVEVGYNSYSVPIRVTNVFADPATVYSTQTDVVDTDGHPCRRNVSLFSTRQGGWPLVGLTGYAWWNYWVHADYYHNGVAFPSRNWERNYAMVVTP